MTFLDEPNEHSLHDCLLDYFLAYPTLGALYRVLWDYQYIEVECFQEHHLYSRYRSKHCYVQQPFLDLAGFDRGWIFNWGYCISNGC